MLFYNARDKKVYGLNGSGRAPKNLSIHHIRARGIEGDSIPLTDLNSVTVPGISDYLSWSAPSLPFLSRRGGGMARLHRQVRLWKAFTS